MAGQNTTLIFYGNQLRGSAVGVLQEILGIPDEMVRHEPQAGRVPQYEILLGADYVPCQQGYVPLQRLPTPTPTPAPAVVDPSLPSDSFFSSYRQGMSMEGNLLDWGELNYPLNQLVSSSDTWLNVTDSSAVWASAWDEQALYFAIRVQDNTLLPAKEGADLWSGDLLELLLDLNLDADRESLLPNEDDWQIGWVASESGQFGLGRLGWVALPSNLRGTSGDLSIYFNVLPAGYEAEFAIPWSLSGHNPQPQQHLGFVLSYFDQDSTEQSQPQSLVSTNRQRNLYDTSTWGRLILNK
ncbi:MAG TPA: sugar-binding protein [Anaerolineales bacterium]|nr:sugar-binding protein [Anaerolineales bacterium]